MHNSMDGQVLNDYAERCQKEKFTFHGFIFENS